MSLSLGQQSPAAHGDSVAAQNIRINQLKSPDTCSTVLFAVIWTANEPRLWLASSQSSQRSTGVAMLQTSTHPALLSAFGKEANLLLRPQLTSRGRIRYKNAISFSLSQTKTRWLFFVSSPLPACPRFHSLRQGPDVKTTLSPVTKNRAA